jgi:hypothetical protein
MMLATAGMEWRHLSSVAEKRRRYAREPYFRESLADAERVLGRNLPGMLHAVALAIVKPEALVARRADALTHFLATSELTPVETGRFAFSRHAVRALWRYQWNAATLEKMELADSINCATETAWLLLRDDAAPRELPASVRLKTLKGAAVPAERPPGSLRAALGAPNRMLTLVHTADEPADVLRELGILLDRQQREALLARLPEALNGDVRKSCESELRRLEIQAPSNDLDAEAAWARLLQRADDIPRAALLEQRTLLERGGRPDARLLRQLCARIGADEWDWIAICAAAMEHDDAGHSPAITFDGDAVARWRDGDEAVLCRA